uniref:Uncharacterized protein n=1 Tax=Octopus bimaculoides TaxID=37653 RepID=A0A0L8FH35_OCTBM
MLPIHALCCSLIFFVFFPPIPALSLPNSTNIHFELKFSLSLHIFSQNNI